MLVRVQRMPVGDVAMMGCGFVLILRQVLGRSSMMFGSLFKMCRR